MKGILKTFEVIIGLTMILIAFIALFTGQQALPEFNTIAWKAAGLNALQALDYSNLLRFDAMNNSTAAIESRLTGYLPSNLNYLVQVCGNNCTSPTITAKRSTTANYIISGDANNSTASEIILYVWSNE